MSKTGRPTKLTEALLEEILTLVEAGNYVHDAVMACGIVEKTYYNWMERGETDLEAGKDTIYVRFLQSAACARAKARCHHVGLILRNAESGRNAQASIEYLSRTDPKHWARKDLVSKGATIEPPALHAPTADPLPTVLEVLDAYPEAKAELVKRLEMMSK